MQIVSNFALKLDCFLCRYNPTIGLGLQLTMEESEEYWRAWVEANGWSGFESTAGEMMYLVDLTQRQPGAFSLLLDRIGDQGWQHLAESEWHRRMQLYLMSEKPIMAMQDLRSLQRYRGLNPISRP